MFDEPGEPAPPPRRPRRRRLRKAALAIGACALALAWAAHLPPVRARVLDAALAWANQRFGVVARARALDYDLFALRFTALGVSVAARHTPTAPFFAAERVEVDLPWSWLRGDRSLQAVRIEGPRIAIASDASDRFNLPTIRRGTGGGTTIEIRELAVRDIALSVDDRVRRVEVQLQRASLRLRAAAGGLEGRLRMGAPGAVQVGAWRTTVTRLTATLTLRGSTLHLEPLTVGTSDGEISVHGTAGLSADAPLDLVVGAQVHLRRVVSALVHGLKVGGTLEVSGRAAGTVAEPQARLALRAARFTYGNHEPGTLTGSLTVSRHAVAIDSLALDAPWGGVTATGRISDRHVGGEASHAGQRTLRRTVANHVDFSWRGIDVTAATAASDIELPLAVAARVRGTGRLEWLPGADVTLRATASVAPGAGRGLPLAGSVRVEKIGPRWTISHELQAPHDLRTRGTVVVDAGGRTAAVSGDSVVTTSRLGAALAAVAAAGVDIAPVIVASTSGDLRAAVTLIGTADALKAGIRASSESLSYAPLPAAQVTARLVVDRDRVEIVEAVAHFATGQVHASGVSIGIGSGRLAGPIEADFAEAGPIVAAFWPELGPVTGRVHAAGRLAGTLRRLHVAADVSARDVTVAGQRLDTLAAAIEYDEPRLSWRGLSAAQGAGSLASDGWIDVDRDELDVTARGTRLVLAPCPPAQPPCGSVMASGAIDTVQLDARGRLRAPSGSLELEAHDVSWNGETAGALSARASFDGGHATVAARLPDRGLAVAGTAALPAPAPFDLTVTAAGSSLSDLLRLAGRSREASRLSGSVSATVRAVGTFEDLQDVAIEASVAPTELVVDGRRWRIGQAARVEYGPDRIEVSGLTVGSGASTASITGGLRREADETMAVTLEGELGDFAGAAGLAEVQVAGHVSARLTVSGTPARPLVTGTTELTDAALAHPRGTLALERVSAVLDAGTIRVTRGELHAGGIHASVGATLPVTLLRDHVPPEVLRALGTPPAGDRATLAATLSGTLADSGLIGDPSLPLSGLLRASVDLEADALRLDALQGRGTVQTAALSVGAARISQASPGVVTIENGRVTLEPWTLSGAGSNLVAAGSIDLGGVGSAPVAATLTGPLQLEPLQAVFGLPVSGLLTADARIRGTVSAPQVEGTITLSGAGLRVRSPRLAVADVRGSAHFEGTAVVLDGVSGLVNGSPFVLAGAVSLPGARSTSPRTLRFTAQRVAVQPFATGPRAETDLDLTYTEAGGERSVTGRADLLPQPFRGSVLALKQFVDAVAAANAPLGAPPRRRAPGASPVTLNIGIDSREPMLVDTNAGRVELAARLTIAGTLDQPTLLGRVTVLDEGIIRAGGRTYTISSGTIDFNNPRRVVPLINLTATTRISTYEITMVVAGTPDSLRTSLTSDPPLAETDLRSLIVTGRLASDTTRQQGGSASERQVIETISGDIFGFAARAIGLDAVSIGNPDLDLLGSDIDARTSLNLTKSLSRQLEVVYSRDLQDDRSSWLVIYRPGRALSLRLLSRDNREGAAEFRQEFRFGGPPPVRDAAAGGRPKAPRVTSVAFTGDLGVAESQLADVLQLRPGSRFDTWKWRGETEQLARFYRERGFYAARILPRRQADGAGVALTYAISRGPRTTLAVDGHEMPPEVLERMRDAWAEAVSTSFLVEDLETIARTHLVDDGYLAPAVRAEIRVQTEAALAVLLHVETGPLVQRRAIDLQGTSPDMAAGLREFLAASGLERASWYNPASLKAPIETFYRDRGYLEAKATPHAVQVTGSAARLPVRVDEGRLFRVARIEVDGADALGAERVRAATGVPVDAPWQSTFVSQALANVQGAYNNAGFADTEVYAEPQVDSASGRVVLYVAVAEGRRQVLQDLAIAGTRVTMTKTVSDLVHLRFGDPITPALVSDVQKRLYDSGVFSRVAVDFTPAPGGSQATTPYDDPVIAKVTITEAPRFSVQYGVQVSRTIEATGTEAEYEPGAAIDFRDRNLLGRALALGLGVRADARLRSGRATLAMPRTYGTSIRSYLFMDSSRGRRVPDAGLETRDESARITAEQRWRKGPRLELSWGVAYDYRRDVVRASAPARDLFTITGDTVGPRLAVVWDSRDDPFDTRRGLFHSSGLDLGLRPLGSDLGYARYLGQTFLFVPKGPLVFASGLRYGGLFTYGPAHLVQIDLRFDAGGSRSVRGYGEDALYAEQYRGVPIGGRQMLVLNEEMRFPIWWWLRGAVFVDAGNTFASLGQVRLGDLKVGAGWGLRLATPVALIRFDAGYPVNDPLRTAPRYYISIGQAF